MAVIEKVDSKSFVEQFYKKMGINYAFKFNDECEDSYKKNNLDLGVKRISKASNVKKWRSVEENTIEILRGFDEIGPGKVLNGLTKRIVAELQATSVNDVASLDAVEALLA